MKFTKVTSRTFEDCQDALTTAGTGWDRLAAGKVILGPRARLQRSGVNCAVESRVHMYILSRKAPRVRL